MLQNRNAKSKLLQGYYERHAMINCAVSPNLSVILYKFKQKGNEKAASFGSADLLSFQEALRMAYPE